MMRRYLFNLTALLSLFIISTHVVGQTYNPSSNQTYNTCSGTFYDSGGAGGNYGNNQGYNVTFCSNNGQPIWLNFTSFNIENSYDYLYIYNGNSTGAPLMGTYTGTNSPTVVVASGTCITIRFTSESSVNYAGWVATVGCGTPPPPPPCTPPAPTNFPPGCSAALPFCTGTTVTFPNSTGTGSAGTYNCLSTTPNPFWYYLEISTPGNIDISIQQVNGGGAGIDVDFALMGPYTSVAAACANPALGCVEDCSYSASATETANITNAQVGEVYMLLLTNYANQAGTISFNQTGGVGATDCSIVNPTCDISNVTATPSACNASNQYSVSGQVTFTDPPTTGTLTVTSSCGGSQTFNAPFVSPKAYTISGLAANGAACTVTATFSADAACTYTRNYSAPTTITPTFAAVGPYCNGAAIPALPTTSTNGINGTWAPAINNTATTTYTFTPTVGQCATTTTLTITITPKTTPTFAAVGPYCNGAVIPALPTTSTNGVTGTWSPAINNTATTTYTFTPTAGLCANTTTLTITITPKTTPIFTAVPPICSGGALAALPTTSNNGVTGTWSPAINNTATTTYTFTPTAGLCANTTTMTITVNPKVTPTFNAVGPYCSGDAIPALPTTSTNGIPGTWAPAINNTTTTTYTFTPSVGQCANTTTLTITIGPKPTPTFNAVPAICSGGALSALPTTSINGINGTWAPALNNTATTTYTFTPNAGQCSNTTTMTITVNPNPVPTATADSVLCNGGSTGSATVTGVTSSVGPYTYSWNSAPVQTTQTATGLPVGSYTVTVRDVNTLCQGQTTVQVFQPTALSATENHVNPTCAQGTNGTATVNPSGGTLPYTYSWSSAPVQTTQTATGLTQGSYTATVTDGNGCTTTATSTLVDPAGMVLNTSMTQADCGQPTGTATVSVTGGSGNFGYSWNTAPVQNTATATAIPAGTYIVTVTDLTFNCVSSDTIIVTTTLGITANAVLISDALCNGSNDGTAYAYPTGGTSPYSYSWNSTPVQTNDTLTAGIGTYTVTITDNVGCTGTASISIAQPTVVVAAISSSTNESCAGANNGTATASGSGGTGVYTYSWNTTPIQNTQTATGLQPGTYTATVYDANLCSSTVNVTINPGPTMTATHTSTNVSCFGGSNGTINATVNGAPGAITYNWMPGSIASEDPVGLSAGIYVMTASSMGCMAYDTVTISQPTQVVAVIDSVSDVVCAGESTGNIYASASGGTGSITYSWNSTPIQTTSYAANIPLGSYILTVTDSLGCQATVNATVAEPAPFAVNLGSLPAYCSLNQGTVWAFPTNGLAPYTFVWDTASTNIGTNDTLTGLYPGSYGIQVQDANNCKFFGNVTVTSSPAGTATISNVVDASCFGVNDGEATVSMSGAYPPYSYQWDAAASNQTTNPAVNLPVGTFTVVVTDNLGCKMSTSATIIAPSALATTTSLANTLCPNSCDGVATTTPTGGTTPYSYLWTDPSSQVTASASNLCQGTFYVQITDDNGCQVSDSVIINNPPAMDVDSAVIAANCNQSDGSADVFVSANGQAPFTFEWSDGTSVISSTFQLTNVPAGTYYATATDFYGCTVTIPVTIPNMAGPQIDSTSKVDVLCFGDNTGSATVHVSGGTIPYTYSWDDPSLQTNPAAVNLIAGSYIVNVTDNNGCNLSTSVTINQPTQLVLNSGGNNPACFGYSDGNVYVSAVGGVTPYSFLWNDALTQTNDTAFNLPQGNYTVTVTDNNGCVEISSTTISDPALFTINVTGTDANCFGGTDGTATVSTNNGISPFTYLWNDPSSQTTQTATSLSANSYSVVTTDDNGCIANGSVTINEPNELILSLDTSLDVSCKGYADGYASLNAIGGTGAYTYTWDLNGTLVATSQSPNNLSAGTHLVTVTDANGCTDQIFVTINEPSGMTASFDVSDVLCAGDNSGYAYVVSSGGVTPYSYQWNAAAALQQTDTAYNLTAGTYDVTITDNNGCTLPITSILINEPQPLTFVTSTVSSTCGNNNGEASVVVGGGTGSYNYVWSTTPIQSTALATGLFAGNYTVVVTDQNGCADSTNVNINDMGSPTVSISSYTNVSCNGAKDGTATASVSGGTLPYTYVWNTSPVQNTLTATGLDALVYNITVTDSNGCVAASSVTISQPNKLIAVIPNPTNVSCNGGTDGQASVLVAGGGPPYTYLWNDGASQNTATASNLSAGTYIVQVSDSNSCMAYDTVTVVQPQLLVVGLDSLKNVNCNAGSDGYIDINVTGGNFPYTTYAWTPNVSSGQTASGLVAGNYSVIVTDNKGCIANNNYTISEPTALLISLSSNPSTCGNNNGSAQVTSTTGGVSPYTYSWNDNLNQQTQLASNLFANLYTVIVKDKNNCTITDTITVNDLAGPVIDSIAKTNIICYGDINGTATVYATGNGLSYAWSPSSQISQQAVALPVGVYSITVTDVNGCTITQGGISITQPPALTADINMPATACYGQSVQLYGIGGGGTPFTPPASPYSVLWGPPFNTTTPGPLFDTVTTNTTYNIVVQDANGCTKFYNETVVVGQPLQLTVPNKEICLGKWADITSSVTGGNANNTFTYYWYAYDSTSSTYVTPTGVVNPMDNPHVSPTTTTQYMAYVSDGCSTNDTAIFTVTVRDTSIVGISSDIDEGCVPLVVKFNIATSESGLTYGWDFDGDGTVNQTTIADSTQYMYTQHGLYEVFVTVTNGYGCKSLIKKPKDIQVHDNPVANFDYTPQVTTIINPEIEFTDLSTPDVIDWDWHFGDGETDLDNQHTMHEYTDTGYYAVTLIVSSEYCQDTITKYVLIKPDFFFAIPNTFTPDGDGLNDFFKPGTLIGVSEKDYNFFIFDRWGDKIWEGHDLDSSWDGKANGGSEISQTGTYVWLIQLFGIDGLQREYRGHVNIVK